LDLNRFQVSDAANHETLLAETTFYLTEETLYHGSASGNLVFPNLTRLLRERASVAVEIDCCQRHTSWKSMTVANMAKSA
jgi:hypothetical protein